MNIEEVIFYYPVIFHPATVCEDELQPLIKATMEKELHSLHCYKGQWYKTMRIQVDWFRSQSGDPWPVMTGIALLQRELAV